MTLPLPALNLTLDSSLGIIAYPYTSSVLSLSVSLSAAAAQHPPRDTVDTGL
jgi:hypothetical protein